jgi:hypothetical protein
MDFSAVSIPQGFEDYLVTILWYFNMDDRSVYEFSTPARERLLDYYDRFYKSIEALGLRGYYVQAYGESQLGHDFALEQLRTGCGFMDRELLKESDRELICQIANCFPEFSVYELENGELEVE